MMSSRPEPYLQRQERKRVGKVNEELERHCARKQCEYHSSVAGMLKDLSENEKIQKKENYFKGRRQGFIDFLQYRLDRRAFWIDVAAVVIAIGAGGLLTWQDFLLRRTMREAKEFADRQHADTEKALQSANDTTVQTIAAMNNQLAAMQGQLDEMRAEQRPIIWTGNLGMPTAAPNGQIMWTFGYLNYGKGIVSGGRVRTYIKLSGGNFEQTVKQPDHGDKLSPSGPNQEARLGVVSKLGVPVDAALKLLQMDNGVSIKAIFSYTDLAGHNYESGICVSKLASGAIVYCPADNYIK